MSTVTGTSVNLSGLVPAAARVPPLQSGDRLSRDEFERRYKAMSAKVKCELIKGVVYVTPPPVSDEGHSQPHVRFVTWLGVYAAYTPGVVAGDNGTVRLDADSEPQPDALLRILPQHGGQSRTSQDDFVEGAPEFVAEIAASSASYDLHDKLDAYRRCGVREYVVWRTWDRMIDWFQLKDGQFVRQSPDSEGLLKSSTFPGLWLDPTALLSGNQARVLQILQQGLAAAEHQEFVATLTRK
ncbi:Uma2 family endonuclease [Anatilimnocola floriformis]|uniref:Uma2 family endonuclease n=1 Tax=Anatilimnocola floriformis TaxID=2948575 RepID=UPI0020C59860|nr:Uma2 family endonuclease [Anatilimnocola floriformis]